MIASGFEEVEEEEEDLGVVASAFLEEGNRIAAEERVVRDEVEGILKGSLSLRMRYCCDSMSCPLQREHGIEGDALYHRKCDEKRWLD